MLVKEATGVYLDRYRLTYWSKNTIWMTIKKTLPNEAIEYIINIVIWLYISHVLMVMADPVLVK